MGVPKTSDNIHINIGMQNFSQTPPASFKAPNEDLLDMDVLCTFKIKMVSQSWEHRCIKDFYHIINITMSNPSQKPPGSSKAHNQDLKDIDVLYSIRNLIESGILEHGCIKDQWPHPNENKDAKPQSGTSSPEKSPKSGHKGHGCTLHPQFKIESQNLEHWCIKDQWPYPNQDQDAKAESGACSVLQSPKSGLKGHGCSLHLQNQDREPKFGSWV